jgi:hypothetical protein
MLPLTPLHQFHSDSSQLVEGDEIKGECHDRFWRSSTLRTTLNSKVCLMESLEWNCYVILINFRSVDSLYISSSEWAIVFVVVMPFLVSLFIPSYSLVLRPHCTAEEHRGAQTVCSHGLGHGCSDGLDAVMDWVMDWVMDAVMDCASRREYRAIYLFIFFFLVFGLLFYSILLLHHLLLLLPLLLLLLLLLFLLHLLLLQVVCPHPPSILSHAYRLAVPVTCRGAGTGAKGQSVALEGGVMLSLRYTISFSLFFFRSLVLFCFARSFVFFLYTFLGASTHV